MVVANNIAAMNAQRQFGLVTDSKKKSTEKLSSGFRINRAADDAAGLAISEKMRRQIRGLTQGIENTKEGISLCKVADGALAEVSDMLNRMEELAVKAANDTNSKEDREYIQQEVDSLVSEIDRIADTTTYNEIPLFRGKDIVILNDDGTSTAEGNISFSDFKLADLSLGQSPFGASSSAGNLQLQAVVNNSALSYNGKTYNLIYGSGGTSHSSMRFMYDDKTIEIGLDSLTPSNYSATTIGGKATWSRDFNYTNDDGIDITLTQKISINEDTSSDKNYAISYSFTNNSDKDIELDFMFHADTAYNNNDRCEGYYIDGNRVNNFKMYSETGSKFNNGSTSSYITSGVPGSFSIVDVDDSLSFTEKIKINGANKPDSLSVCVYSRIDDWSYYNNLNSNLGGNANRQDLGFSLLWNDDLSQGDSIDYSFTYGIAAVDSDPNMKDVPINKSQNLVMDHLRNNRLWIQSGSEAWVGMYIDIGEMNSDVLGIRGIDVSTPRGAQRAMEQTKIAQEKLMENRSHIGAQQNRLEHTVTNEDNIVENTTVAESRIRDTDMAKEMVAYSLHNILEQAGTSMMAQANQSNQNVLSLLQ